MDEIRKSQGQLDGAILGPAGLVLGYACLSVATALAILLFGIFNVSVSINR